MRSSSAAVRSQTLQLRLGLPADRRSAPVETYTPGQRVDDLKSRFDKINAFVMARGGFVVSIPGSPDVVFEALPESTLPDELAGYDIRPADPPETMRLLAHAIEQKLTLSSCGIFETMTEGSTKAVAQVRTHDGICRVLRFTFTL